MQMGDMKGTSNGHHLGIAETHRNKFFSSQRDVTYSCGSCGYDLNLSSSNRNTATIGSKYGKSIKRGIISFTQIDESRFTQVEEFHCIPYFISKYSWSLFQPKTKLLCRKCGTCVGDASYEKNTYNSFPAITDGASSSSSSANESSGQRKFDIKIRTLQPSSADQSGRPLVM